jgi:uncharacterized protein YeeX (DUF496 family)
VLITVVVSDWIIFIKSATIAAMTPTTVNIPNIVKQMIDDNEERLDLLFISPADIPDVPIEFLSKKIKVYIRITCEILAIHISDLF